MDINNIIKADPGILGGQPVFANTRVPVESLFDYLEEGVPLDEFLSEFPTVSREQAVALLEVANKLLTTIPVERLHATLA
jgi:uncharacterized protein (DUF433 family)